MYKWYDELHDVVERCRTTVDGAGIDTSVDDGITIYVAVHGESFVVRHGSVIRLESGWIAGSFKVFLGFDVFLLGIIFKLALVTLARWITIIT